MLFSILAKSRLDMYISGSLAVDEPVAKYLISSVVKFSARTSFVNIIRSLQYFSETSSLRSLNFLPKIKLAAIRFILFLKSNCRSDSLAVDDDDDAVEFLFPICECLRI